MNPKRFHLTVHVQRRVSERGLSVQALTDVVKYAHTRQKQYLGEHGGTVFRFSKTVGGVKLTAVAEVKGQDCWLVTGFYG